MKMQPPIWYEDEAKDGNYRQPGLPSTSEPSDVANDSEQRLRSLDRGTIMKAHALLAPALVFVALTAHAQSTPLDPIDASRSLKRRAYFKYRATRHGTFGLAPMQVQGSLDTAVGEIEALPVAGEPWVSRGPNNIDRSMPPSNYDHASGRVLSLALAPPDDIENFDKIYLGSAGGGVWRSIDDGAHWQPLTDDMPSPSIGALAVHATNPRIIFAGTGEIADCLYSCLYGLGIYRSLDAGHSWVQQGADLFRGAAVSAIEVNPDGTDTNHVFVATVFKNTPGIPTPPIPPQGVAVSTDLGASWCYQPSPGPDPCPPPMPGPNSLYGRAVTDLVIDGRGNLYAAVSDLNGCTAPAQGCGIWYSSDEARTWSQISNGLPATGGKIHKLALAPSTAGLFPGHQTLYVVIGDTGNDHVLGVFRTDNGGAENPDPNDPMPDPTGVTTWQVVGNNAAMGPCSLGDLGQQAWYNIYVGVDPNDPDTVFVGLTDIYSTSSALPANCGRPPGTPTNWSNFTNVTAPFPNGANIHADQHAILFFRSDDILFGNDGGVYRSQDGGLTFSSENGDLQLAQFYGGALHPNPAAGEANRLLGGTQDNGVLQTPDAAANGWVTTARIQNPGPPPVDFYFGDGFYVAIDYNNAQNWYGEAFTGITGRSSDGGATWSIADSGLPHDAQFAAPLVMDPRDPMILYSGQLHLWRTRNGMTTWSDISAAVASSTLSAIAVAPITTPPMDQRTIYIADTGGRAWRTRDSGTNWTAINPPAGAAGSYITALAVNPNNPRVVYAAVNGFQAGGGRHLFRSDDGGDHWQDRSTSLPNIPFQSVAVNPTHPTVIYAGADIGVYLSRDSGLTWQTLGTGLPRVPVFYMVPTAGGEQLTVFTHGRGAWRAPDAICPATSSCGQWVGTGSLALDRGNHTAVLLADGTVLVAGGDSDTDPIGITPAAERYDPTNGAWSATGAMNKRRESHTATLLSDGRVLAVGGDIEFGQPSTSEIYDPATGNWVMSGTFTAISALRAHSATLLADGSVLVAGGCCDMNRPVALATRFDPATGTWSPAASMNVPRQLHSATLLLDGRVLVAGGRTIDNATTGAVELYDPAINSWTMTASLATARSDHVATMLPDGTVLVAGGSRFDRIYESIASAERYYPNTGAWTSAGGMTTGRSFASGSLMAAGRVVVSGGFVFGGMPMASADVYDPETNSWAATGSMGIDRNSHTVTLLPDGTVLAAGGYGGPTGGSLASCDRYRPAEVPPGL